MESLLGPVEDIQLPKMRVAISNVFDMFPCDLPAELACAGQAPGYTVVIEIRFPVVQSKHGLRNR